MKTTIRNVAEIAGVSITTVSHVLNNKEGTRVRPETRKKVLEAARRLNYHLGVSAKPGYSKKTGVLGLLLPRVNNCTYLDSQAELLRQIEMAVEEIGYHLMVESVKVGPKGDYLIPRMVKEGKIDGCLVVDILDETAGGLLAEMGSLLPVVSIDHEHQGVDSVVQDNFRGGVMATEYLFSKGCKSVICLCPEADGCIGSTYSERIDGFMLSAARCGMSDVAGSVVAVPENGAYKAIHDLLSGTGRPDGVFATDGAMARHFKDVAETMGVNGDVGLVAFDYQEPWSGNLAVDTVRVDLRSLARNAIKLLMDRLQGNPAGDVRVVVKAELMLLENAKVPVQSA